MRQTLHGGPKQKQNGNKGANGGKRPPGRPRSEHARLAILRSTLKLLRTTGFNELSIESIAADANVGKATVYRWWPNKGTLVVDAFASSTEDRLHFPDTGSLLKDVSLQMKQVIGLFRSRRGRIVAALVGGGQTDPELLEAFRERFLWPRRQEAYRTLRRGIARHELPPHVDLDLLLDVLYGAIYMRFLIRHSELSDEYVSEVCRVVLGGAANNGRSPLQNGSKARTRSNDHPKSAAIPYPGAAGFHHPQNSKR